MSFGVRLHVCGRACLLHPAGDEGGARLLRRDDARPRRGGSSKRSTGSRRSSGSIDRIHVLKPIRFQSFRRNEVGTKISADKRRSSAMRSGNVAGLGLVVEDNRQQRATTLLVDVAYVIEAHFDLTDKAGPDDTPAKHSTCSTAAPRTGNASISPASARASSRPISRCSARTSRCRRAALPDDQRNRDLGWMLYDIDFADGRTSRFFRAG